MQTEPSQGPYISLTFAGLHLANKGKRGLTRLQCDEAKPSCTRCRRSNVECRYCPPSKAKAVQNSAVAGYSRSAAALSANYSPLPFAQPSSIAVAEACLQSKSPTRGVSRVSLLHHINQNFHSLQGLESAGGQMVVILSMASSRPYLLDVVLAVAASHLRHMHQATGNTSIASAESIAACRVAEHYQQSLALRGFRSALGETFDQEGADSVITCSMMLNLLAFALDEEEDPMQSWIFSTSDSRLEWFKLGMGLTPVLMNTKQFHDKSVLRYIFDASDDVDKTYHGEEPKPLSKVPFHWLRLCGLDYTSNDPDHVFYEPVRILAELVPVPANHQSFFLYTAFFGKLNLEFQSMLEVNHEVTVWMLGYWLGILCRFEHIWWLSSRVRRDYRAVCIWLDQRKVRRRPGADGEMWRQLMLDLEGATQPPVSIQPWQLDKPATVELIE